MGSGRRWGVQGRLGRSKGVKEVRVKGSSRGGDGGRRGGGGG